jgi:flagellar basal-body rod modification protein FlgD
MVLILDYRKNMEISQTPPAFSANAATSQNEPAEISSDFDTFLRMLTVQLQNQDPLNPVESSDYAVQLATFSGVEQQVQTNDLLRSLAGQMAGTSMVQLASWVGKEARAVAPAQFDGLPVTVFPTVAEGASSAQLVVQDGEGVELQRIEIGLDGAPIKWAGVTTDGQPFPAGQYRFDTISYDGEVELNREQAAIYDKVTEVRTTNGIASLILRSGAEVLADDVTALRGDPTSTQLN